MERKEGESIQMEKESFLKRYGLLIATGLVVGAAADLGFGAPAAIAPGMKSAAGELGLLHRLLPAGHRRGSEFPAGRL